MRHTTPVSVVSYLLEAFEKRLEQNEKGDDLLIMRSLLKDKLVIHNEEKSSYYGKYIWLLKKKLKELRPDTVFPTIFKDF
jgi:hypothetical protein